MNLRNRLTFWSASAFGMLILLAGMVIHAYYRNSPVRWNSFMVGDPHEGATLFFEKKGCARCHAVNGVGANLAPDLGFSRSPQASLAQIVSAMWNHAPKMWEAMRAQGIAYPDLDREDMVNLFPVHGALRRRARRRAPWRAPLRVQRLCTLPRGAGDGERPRTGPCERERH